MELLSATDITNNRSRLTLAGSVERVTYFNQETGQCVLEVKTSSDEDRVLVAGKTSWVYPGLTIQAEIQLDNNAGTWHKPVLHADELQFSAPRTARTLRKFLKSEAMPDVGPQLAKILADAFPKDLFWMLDNSPEVLLEVQGIGKKKLTSILSSWKEYKSKSELQVYFFEQKLPLNWSLLLWMKYGESSLGYFQRHPYDTVAECGLSFELVDAYALRHGFALDGRERLRAGLKNSILNHFRQGHCAYPEDQVIEECSQQLEVPRALVEDTLEIEILKDEIMVDQIRGQNCLYVKSVWQTEQDVAQKLLQFQEKTPPWGYFNTQKSLGWAQNILGIKLAQLQKEAIERSLSSSLTVITGGPGTGKTTLIRSLVTILQTQFLKFALCSPTGRAAQRLGDATGMPAQTIHRLLKYDSLTGKFSFNKERPLDFDLVLVDEASMLDLSLMNDLLDALPERCALILVGDADQLPSVGAGNVLHSLISSNLFEVVRLTNIFRQSEDSLIIKNAQRINEGLMPIPTTGAFGDFHYIPVKGVDEAKRAVMHLLNRVIPEKCGIKDQSEFQVLVPLNRGPLGTQQLNQELQEQIAKRKGLNDFRSTSEYGQDFKLGDKVMVIKNDYKKDVYNGDVGFIEILNFEERFLDVNFGTRTVRFEFYELDKLTLAYAISIHKSQGSEYRAIVVVITDEHISMVQRHLIYTAVTRGKEHVFLVANPVALQTALQEIEPRWEKLTELLQQSYEDMKKSASMALELLQ